MILDILLYSLIVIMVFPIKLDIDWENKKEYKIYAKTLMGSWYLIKTKTK